MTKIQKGHLLEFEDINAPDVVDTTQCLWIVRRKLIVP